MVARPSLWAICDSADDVDCLALWFLQRALAGHPSATKPPSSWVHGNLRKCFVLAGVLPCLAAVLHSRAVAFGSLVSVRSRH